MIANTLEFVTDQLDNFLKRKTSGNRSIVKLSSLVSPDGSLSVTENNMLIVSIVNIAEEGSIANQPNIRGQNNELIKQAPPVYLNIFILISALFNEDQYKAGLHWLSMTISFFQQHPYFTSELNDMPENVDKLSFELVNLDIDNMSRFWGALGARYQPSVIYKMRMLKISSDTMEAVLPEIREPRINN